MKKIQDLISQMTLDEKASLCSGRDFWYLKGLDRFGIPAIMVADGPHGLRKQIEDPSQEGLLDSAPATCFPTASALAATWNRDLIFEVGQALAKECKEEQVSVLLGPGVNIKRSPLCGRNFEYFSEDPYISGQMAKSYINGVQSMGIGTSLKHYAVNNQEYRRMTINAVVDERALREIYLAGFEIAVKGAQPWTVMGAYNQINGIYACENEDLLTSILYEEWGYQGLAVSDWGAMNDRVEALKAGLAIEMPGPNNRNDAALVTAVNEGRLAESILDRAVERILQLISAAVEARDESYTYEREKHHVLARRAAAEGAVLLKNQGQALPLSLDLKVALIGEMAKTPRFQGAGSSLVNPSRVDCLFDEMAKITGSDRIDFSPGYDSDGSEVNPDLVQAAWTAASAADVVVICAGLPDSFEVEGLDREHIRLPENHNQLIESLADRHPRVVVVLSNGAPVEMPWIDQVQAVLEGYLAGQAGGGALAEILYGISNPSGKLAETFPLQLDDTPCYQVFPGGPKTVEYRESLYVGYRYYDSVNKDVLFPFGHGLSYTTYKYSDLTLSATRILEAENLTIRLKVKNSGDQEGMETVQLYVRPMTAGVFRPEKELKGFEKVLLMPGEEKEIQFELDRRAFAHYSTALQNWHVETGQYQILVGGSSRDIRCQEILEVESRHPEAPVFDRDCHPSYVDFPLNAVISQEDYEMLLGSPLPENVLEKKGQYTLNTPLSDLRGSVIGRWLLKIIQNTAAKMIEDDPESPNALMIRSMVPGLPLRALATMGGERISRTLLEVLLAVINGKPGMGIKAIFRSGKSGK